MMSLNVETLKRATGPLFFNPEAWANSHPSRRYCPEHPVATIYVPAGKNSDTAEALCIRSVVFDTLVWGGICRIGTCTTPLCRRKKPQVRPSTISILKPTIAGHKKCERDPTGVGSRFNLSAQFVVKNDWTRG